MGSQTFGKIIAILAAIGLATGCEHSKSGRIKLATTAPESQSTVEGSTLPEAEAGSETSSPDSSIEVSGPSNAHASSDGAPTGTVTPTVPDVPTNPDIPTTPGAVETPADGGRIAGEMPTTTENPVVEPVHMESHGFIVRNITPDEGVTVGQTVRFTVSIRNDGADARDIHLVDYLKLNGNPLHGGYYDCEGNTPPSTYNPDRGFVCDFPTFPLGSTKFVTLWVTVTPSFCPALLTTSAQIFGGPWTTYAIDEKTVSIGCGTGAPTADPTTPSTQSPVPADDAQAVASPLNEEPVHCTMIPGGLFQCDQGEDRFCATLFGERRGCPVQCNALPGGLFRCRQAGENFCATLMGERRECPATEPVCEPLAEHPDIDLCHEDGGSSSWCQTSGSPERVVCPVTRTGRYTSRLCKDLGTHLRCVSHANTKFTLFCADRETGERTGCPYLGGYRFAPFDDFGRIYVVREKGVTWCVMGKPVNGEIFDPIECPAGSLPEGF